MLTLKNASKIALSGLLLFSLASCESDDDGGGTVTPPVGNDEEVITDLILTFEDAEGALPSQSFTFSDPDGPGGEAPTIDVISIAPGAYIVSITVLDASDPNDIEDLTEEIAEEEADEHQFFFELLNNAGDVITIDYADADENGNPIGQLTLWGVSDVTSGDELVRITLIHEPNKDAPGASDGILSSEVGGETDIEVEFEVSVQ